MFKRIFDLFFSIFFLVLSSPIFLFVALKIKIEDGGPIFYKGERVGKNFRMFKLLKFRTMVVNADKIGPSSTSNDDYRITKTGKFLRKTKLDELPQLLNIVAGSMSFVGPRPQVLWAVDTYLDQERCVFFLKPGITDYASIQFHNEGQILQGYSDPDKAYLELIHPVKKELQIKYFNDRSFCVDIKIIFRTLLIVLFKSR